MTREEMMTIVRTFDITEGHTCEGCPLAAECELHELWWGCDVWESGMGEDLQTPKQIKKNLKKVLQSAFKCGIIKSSKERRQPNETSQVSAGTGGTAR